MGGEGWQLIFLVQRHTHTIYVKGSILIQYLVVHLFWFIVLVFFGVKFVFSWLSWLQKEEGRGVADFRNRSLIGFVDCLLALCCFVNGRQFMFCSVPTVMGQTAM